MVARTGKNKFNSEFYIWFLILRLKILFHDRKGTDPGKS